jgi:hypothetical protein
LSDLRSWQRPALDGRAEFFWQFFLNIARLHVRDLRGGPVSDSRLGATVHPHAANAGATDTECCRHRRPSHRRGDVAEGGTAHIRFVRIEGFV